MSTKITCSKCGATIIEHLLKPGEESACPRCGQMNTVPNRSDTADSSSVGPSAISSVVMEPLPVRHNLASPLKRLFAQMINTAALTIAFLLGMITSKVFESTYPVNFWVPTILLCGVQIYLLTRDGQSIGKRILDIRIVMNESGVNGGFVPNVLLRVIVNTVLVFIPLYGLVDILFIARHDRRCIHDWIAGTVVVEPVKVPPVDQF